jgi:hypothetical protein
MVKKALMSSLETTSAITFAELFSCIKRKLHRLGRGCGKLHNHYSVSATELSVGTFDPCVHNCSEAEGSWVSAGRLVMEDIYSECDRTIIQNDSNRE